MTPAEHYHYAEQMLGALHERLSQSPAGGGGVAETPAWAQVHATLAQCSVPTRRDTKAPITETMSRQ